MKILLASLFVVVSSIYLTSCKPNRDSLVDNLNSRLREENINELYEQSSDFLRLNVSKEQFIERMSKVVTKLKAIDENLSFQRDKDSEKSFDERNEGVLITSVQKLGTGDEAVTVLYSWSNEGKFNDLSVHSYSKISKKAEMLSILYKE